MQTFLYKIVYIGIKNTYSSMGQFKIITVMPALLTGKENVGQCIFLDYVGCTFDPATVYECIIHYTFL